MNILYSDNNNGNVDFEVWNYLWYHTDKNFNRKQVSSSITTTLTCLEYNYLYSGLYIVNKLTS